MGEDFICDPYTAGSVFTSVILFFSIPLMGVAWATQEERTEFENRMLAWAVVWFCVYYAFMGFIIYLTARTLVCNV